MIGVKREYVKRVFTLGLTILLTGFSVQSVSAQTSDTETEYRIKALYLFNFAKETEWAAFCFPSSSTPMIIAIVGEDPFGGVIDGALAGKKIGSRSIVIKRFDTVDDIDMCHILFVSESEQKNMDRVVEAAKFWYALTVADFRPFAEKGGIINFIIQNERIRIEYNPAAARDSFIKVSPEIRRVAKVVKTDR